MFFWSRKHICVGFFACSNLTYRTELYSCSEYKQFLEIDLTMTKLSSSPNLFSHSESHFGH